MKKPLQLSFVLISLFFIQTILAQNNSLNFDGSNDYVVTNSINLSGSALTMECWIKPESFQDSSPYISSVIGTEATGSTALIRIGDAGLDKEKLQFVLSFASTQVKLNANTSLIANHWYHIAAVYDGVNMKIYINGILDASQAQTGSFTSNDQFYFGSMGTDRYFDGDIDEVRLWNDARTVIELRSNMYKNIDLPESEPNLISYYKFDATSGITLSDSKASNNGTLNNMDNEDWLTSSAFFGPKNCLDFDGGNNNVWCSSFSPTVTSGTIEFWMNPEALADDNARIISRGANYSFGDEIYLISGDGRLNTVNLIIGNDLISSISIPIGEWTHVAISADGSGSKLYLNGILDDTGGAADFSFNTFRIGGQYTNDFWETFNGKMDEVRVWNDIRTSSEIQEKMCTSLIGNEANLVAYYNFDNTSGTIVQDMVNSSNDGEAGGGPLWVASTAFNSWLNTNSTNAASSENWSQGSIPTSTDNVGISSHSGNDPVISTTFDCNHFSLETGASLSMSDGASFLPLGNEYINGSFIINKIIAGDSKWHLISAPNNNTTTTDFTNYFLQSWNETSATWEQVTELDIAMNPVKGYSLFDIPNSKVNFSFTGTPNTGEQTYSLTYHDNTGDNDGMNLIGNPYPSAIDWDQLHETYGAIYVWDPSLDGGEAYMGDYIEWNGGVGDAQYIAPMQGFFIQSTSNQTFTIDNDARTHTGAGSFYKSSNSEIENGIILSTNQQDKLYIKLMGEASDGFDFIYDAYKIVSLGESNSQLYSKYYDTKLAIDCRPETELIQLGYQNNQNGQYSIEKVEIDGIAIAEIEDTKTNLFHNLNENPYVFEWNTNDSEERFILHLKATATEELVAQEAQVYSHDGQVYIRQTSSNEFNSIAIFDLAGRVVYSGNLSQSGIQSIDMNGYIGAYLVRIIGEGQSITKKVILK